MYTAASALIEALAEAGVSHVFANFGSDHPGIIEAVAEARARGRPVPAVITCPSEMVALSAAHGHAQVSGRAQAVLVHVECGTQSLAGAVHNAAKGRIPVLIFAGLSPFTQEGELKGSRNEFIQWIQDVRDQPSILRQYVKYDNELRSARNVKQIVHRALQLAASDPKGPVYLTAAREVLEETTERIVTAASDWPPIAPAALPLDGIQSIANALIEARRPLVVTSYLGRIPAAVEALQRLCRRLGVGVIESVPSRMNFPHDNELYLGSQWNEPRQNAELAEADAVLVLDSDVPWIPTVSRPREDAVVYHVDVDPLKEAMPLWYIKARRTYRADAATALRQLEAYVDCAEVDPARIAERRRHYADRHRERQAEIERREEARAEAISPEFLTACVRREMGPDAIALSEGITNYPVICDHIAPTRPGSFFASGGGSLGWNGGAALGAKLAAPDKMIVALTGDGSYMFSAPSAVHWMARRYRTPFLQVIYNNGGWKAPKFSALAVHPQGYASRAPDIDVSFDPPPDYAAIAAAAGGAYARRLERPEEVEAAVRQAVRIVREEKRCAVLDVLLPHL